MVVVVLSHKALFIEKLTAQTRYRRPYLWQSKLFKHLHTVLDTAYRMMMLWHHASAGLWQRMMLIHALHICSWRESRLVRQCTLGRVRPQRETSMLLSTLPAL